MTHELLHVFEVITGAWITDPIEDESPILDSYYNNHDIFCDLLDMWHTITTGINFEQSPIYLFSDEEYPYLPRNLPRFPQEDNQFELIWTNSGSDTEYSDSF